VKLAELARKVTPPDVIDAPSPPPRPLLSLVVTAPDRLLRRVDALLPVIAPARRASLAARLGAARTSGLYGELLGVELGLDEESGFPTCARLKSLLMISPPSGARAASLVDSWQELLAALWPATDEGAGPRCLASGGRVLCHAGLGEEPGAEELSAFLRRGEESLERGVRGVSLTLDFERLLIQMEELLTVPVLWALVPEDLAKLQSLTIDLSEKPDRLRLVLSGPDSDLLRAIGTVFSSNPLPIPVPPGLALVVFTSVDSVEQNLEAAQVFWSDKWRLPRKYRVGALLDRTWKTQLVELASGIMGLALVESVSLFDLDLTDPLDSPGLVVFIQPADPETLDKRLAHVFSGRYYRLAEYELATGDQATRALRKRGKTRGTDRLAWVRREGTYYFATSVAVLDKFMADLEAARERNEAAVLDLAPEAAVQAHLDVPRFLHHLTLSKEAGLAAGLAFGVFKTSVAEMDGRLELRVSTRAAEGQAGLVVEVDNLLGTLDRLLEKAGPLLKLLPTRGS